MLNQVDETKALSNLISEMVGDRLRDLYMSYHNTQNLRLKLKQQIEITKTNMQITLMSIEESQEQFKDDPEYLNKMNKIREDVENLLEQVGQIEQQFTEQEVTINQTYTKMAEEVTDRIAPDITAQERTEFVQQLKEILREIAESTPELSLPSMEKISYKEEATLSTPSRLLFYTFSIRSAPPR